MTLIACTTSDVLPWPCPCKSNGWDHDWDYASLTFQPQSIPVTLMWCANCDCCIADRPTPLAP